MSCHIGLVIIGKNEGTVVFGNVKNLSTSSNSGSEEENSDTDTDTDTSYDQDTCCCTSGVPTNKKKCRAKRK